MMLYDAPLIVINCIATPRSMSETVKQASRPSVTPFLDSVGQGGGESAVSSEICAIGSRTAAFKASIGMPGTSFTVTGIKGAHGGRRPSARRGKSPVVHRIHTWKMPINNAQPGPSKVHGLTGHSSWSRISPQHSLNSVCCRETENTAANPESD